MKRLGAVLRSPLVRWVFLAIALGFIVWYIITNAEQIGGALGRLSPWMLLAAAAASVAYVFATLEAWRQVLHDLGNRLGFRPAVALFGVSQLGKYIPGGVWNIAAAAELGAAEGIPRRHSVAAMSLALLVSIVSGTAVGAIGFLVSPAPVFAQWGWVLWAGIPLLVLLVPPVMNRLIALAWRLARFEPLDTTISTKGISVVTGWSVLAWILAGGSVALLAIGMGAPPTLLTVAQCVGGYALAWVAGFLVVISPAGVGIREAVLALCLAGTVDSGAVIAIVVVSRALLTAVDLILAGVGAIDTRVVARRARQRSAEA